MGSNKKEWLFKDLKHFKIKKKREIGKKGGEFENSKRNLKHNGIKLCKYKLKLPDIFYRKYFILFIFIKR